MKLRLILTFLICLSIFCAKIQEKLFQYNDFIFGSYLTIKIFASDSVQAKRSIRKIMRTLRHIDTVASVYIKESEVSKLNRKGCAIMSRELKELIMKAIEVSEKSEGAFDITVRPAMKVWGLDSLNVKQSPVAEKNFDSAVVNLINYKKIRIIGDSIYLAPGMELDLGGLAVGYAVDKACEVAKASGIKSGLIDAGGDIACFGNKTYKIGIRNPFGKGAIKAVKVRNQSISTSGSYEKFIQKNNKKYTHIINPKTGQPIVDSVDNLVSVTVIADKTVDADAYATAVFVLGTDKGAELISSLGLKGILITKTGKLIEIGF
ncbi:MAG: FAD:protein FMN transferase [candidate division WOR-3 bacterium]|nr:FAD:protein FMN transferase [candidate division WOR-3 bacterium]